MNKFKKICEHLSSAIVNVGYWVGVSVVVLMALMLIPISLCFFAASILAAINIGRSLAAIFFILGLAFWTLFVWIVSNRKKIMRLE